MAPHPAANSSGGALFRNALFVIGLATLLRRGSQVRILPRSQALAANSSGCNVSGLHITEGFEPDVALSPNDRHAAMIGEQGNAHHQLQDPFRLSFVKLQFPPNGKSA